MINTFICAVSKDKIITSEISYGHKQSSDVIEGFYLFHVKTSDVTLYIQNEKITCSNLTQIQIRGALFICQWFASVA